MVLHICNLCLYHTHPNLRPSFLQSKELQNPEGAYNQIIENASNKCPPISHPCSRSRTNILQNQAACNNKHTNSTNTVQLLFTVRFITRWVYTINIIFRVFILVLCISITLSFDLLQLQGGQLGLTPGRLQCHPVCKRIREKGLIVPYVDVFEGKLVTKHLDKLISLFNGIAGVPAV